MSDALAELERERIELTNECQKIDIQLADTNRIDPETGDRLRGYDYLDWKQRAATAKRTKLNRLREVNLLIKEENKKSEQGWRNDIIQKLDYIIELLLEEEDEPIGDNIR
jgi:hypothetical protein